MGLELFTIFGIGFLLGLRHTFDPDHIVAVSTIASRTGNIFKAATSGIFWGIGHTLTLFIVGVILIGLKATVPETVALSMELLVGIMLVILGWTTFQSFRRKKGHIHIHEHKDGERHVHFHSHTETDDHAHDDKQISSANTKSLLIGVIHGLAGSGALVLLTMTSMNTMAEAALYILIFGIGTILGMMIFALLIGLPFVLLSKYASNIEQKLGMAAGLFSIAFGLFFMYEIAFLEGLFKL